LMNQNIKDGKKNRCFKNCWINVFSGC
jgi:hypothetical protein